MRHLFVLVLLLVLSACEPMGPIPGRGLAGETASHPDSWDAFNDEVVQLETRGPYSVNIWGVGIGSAFYIAASEGSGNRWAQRITEDPNVKLRIRGKIYNLTATPVTDEKERESVAKAFEKKYDINAREDFPDVILFRLDARQ